MWGVCLSGGRPPYVKGRSGRTWVRPPRTLSLQTVWPSKVVEKMGERYVQWHSNDCRRVKEELVAKPSHHEGRVHLSDVQPSHAIGRRSLFTEHSEDLEKLGALGSWSSSATPSQEPGRVGQGYPWFLGCFFDMFCNSLLLLLVFKV